MLEHWSRHHQCQLMIKIQPHLQPFWLPQGQSKIWSRNINWPAHFFINFRIQIHLDIHLYKILYSSRSAPYLSSSSSWSSSWGRWWRNDLSPRLDRARINAQCGLWCLLPSYNTAVIIFSIIQVITNFSNPANRMADSSSATLPSSSVRDQKFGSRKCPQSSNGAKEARCQRAPTKNSQRPEALPPKSPGGQEGPLTSGTCWWYLMMF